MKIPHFNNSMLFAMALIAFLSSIVTAESKNVKTYDRFMKFILPEQKLIGLTRQEFHYRYRRGTKKCRWSATNFRLDCKLINLKELGGLKKVARGDTKILDLSHCKIKNAKTLIEGLKAMPYIHQIYLDYNNIRYIPKNLFWNNRGLRVISLHGNQLRTLPQETLWMNYNLEMLRLSRNRLKKLPPKLLYRNRKLRGIELWENDIEFLPPTFFWKNTYLEYVSLSWNNIQNLPPLLFQTNIYLARVKLFHNKLWCVSSRQFEKNQELRRVNIGANQLITLPSTVFSHNTKLEDVMMWSNKMKCLPTGIFDFNQRLKKVNLLSQYKQSTHNGNLKYMQYMYNSEQDIRNLKNTLDKENIEWCEDKRNYKKCSWDFKEKILNCESASLTSFKGIHLPCDVSHLNVANNRFGDTRKLKPVFEMMPDLISVMLSENKINSTMDHMFDSLLKLETIDLSMNNIGTLPPNIFRKLRRLETVDLSKNALADIRPDTFTFSSNLRKVNLAYNDCEELTEKFFSSNKFLVEVNLNNNKIIGLPNDSFKENSNLEILDVSFNQLEHISSNVFKPALKLRSLNLKENRLVELERDSFRNLLHLRTLDLSNNFIEFLPDAIFKANENLEKVYLNGNQLYKLNQHLFDNNPALNFVSLDANFLADVPEKMFSENKNLEALGLQHNCISYIPQNVFKNKPRLREVGLKGNPTLPWEVRKVFEGEEEIQILRKRLKQIADELVRPFPSITEPEFLELPDSEEMEADNSEERPLIGNRPGIAITDNKFSNLIPVEKLRDSLHVDNLPKEGLPYVGAEPVDYNRLRSYRVGEDQSENERSRKRRDTYAINRHKRSVYSLRDFEYIALNVEEEESFESVCKKVWRKSGLF